MNILFIHGNFPGQFKYLASGLGSTKQHNVVFLTGRTQSQCPKIEGVNIHNFESHREVGCETHHYLKATEEAVIKGQAVIREINNLILSGFLGHSRYQTSLQLIVQSQQRFLHF